MGKSSQAGQERESQVRLRSLWMNNLLSLQRCS